MLDLFDEIEFEAVGGAIAERFCDTIDGRSPFNGTMLFTLQLSVHNNVIDDECVVSIMGRDGAHIAKRTSPTGFENDAAITDAICELLELEQTCSHEKLQPALAMLGYRFTYTPLTAVVGGLARGHVGNVSVFAEPISDLDAAMQLRLSVDEVLDVLDSAGADSMRQHVRYGAPYHVALRLSEKEPEYCDVVEYMRALGAHTPVSATHV